MSELVLWGFPRSSNVQKVLWALEELGLKYEHKEIGGTVGGTKEAAYLALNPNGLVPTLVENGEPLWESHAIVRHLYAQYGQSPAHPASAVARARAGGWQDWQATTLWPALRTLMIQLVRTPEAERDQKVIDTARAQADAALAVLEGELSKRAYLVNDDFTWGDIPVAVALQRWFNFPLARQETRHVSEYYARIQKRAAFERWVDV